METQGNQSLFFEATVIEKYKFLDGNTGISEFFFAHSKVWRIPLGFEHISLKIKLLKKIKSTVEKTVDFPIKKHKNFKKIFIMIIFFIFYWRI